MTDEQLEFFLTNQYQKTSKEVAQLMNDTFGLSLTASQIATYRRNHKIHSGVNGQFQKNHVPWNKGKPFCNPNKETYKNTQRTQFKDGHVPYNTQPVGTIRVRAGGYIVIKVDENIRPSRLGWVSAARVFYEEVHGPIPKESLVLHLDGDPTNCMPDNIAVVTKAEMLTINQYFKLSDDVEINKAIVNLAKLKCEIYKRGKHDKNN